MALTEEKTKLRQKIWDLIEGRDIARFPLPPHGRIPNFAGSETAAEKLKELNEWRRASVVLVNPDSAQRAVRENVLEDGKVLIMPSPKLKEGYLVVDPTKVKGKERYASSIKGAFELGEKVSPDEIRKVDFVVEGSVAVDPAGNRLGKGGAFGDIEIAMCRRINPDVRVATTVHDVQIVDSVPGEAWDQKVDIIVTPTRAIRIGKKR